MAAQFTHRILAERTLQLLPAQVRRAIQSLPAYFLGAQGADILYFLHIRRGKEKNLGSYFHNIGVYESFCSFLSMAKESSFAFSYAAGYITHYAADTVFHPFVYGMIERFNEYEPEWRGRRHAYIENDIDSYFVRKYCGMSVQNYPFPRLERHVNVSGLYAVLCRVCRDSRQRAFSERALRAALDRFFRFGQFFTDEKLRRRKFFGGAERTLHVPHLFSSMYRRPDYDERCLNPEHREWYNPSNTAFVSCESADDLFVRAEKECARLLAEFYRAVTGGEPLPQEDFGKSMLTGEPVGVPLVRPRAGMKGADPAAADGK